MSASVFAAEADAEQAGRLEAALKAAGASVELRASPQPLRGVPVPDGLGPGVEVLSVFVGSRIDGELLAACPDLRGRVLGWWGPGTSASTWPRSAAASAWRSSPPTHSRSRCSPR